MNCCTILIKIKDFLPKLSKIPYDNYICIFTHDEFEGRISLMQYKYQHINHEIIDIKSDINYKIKVVDVISNKIIGISEHCINYDIINKLDLGTSINFINQIRVLPGQKPRQKISSNLNAYNKLNLTISTEIIKFNKTPINYISNENSEFLKLNLKLYPNKNKKKYININLAKTDNSYKNIKINRIKSSINKINKKEDNSSINEDVKDINSFSYRKGKDNLSTSGIFNEEDKNNINLNMHNITVKNYYTINPSTAINLKSVKNNQIYTKKYLKQIRINRQNKNDSKKHNENIYDFLKQNELKHKSNIKIKSEYNNSTENKAKINKINSFENFNSIESFDKYNTNFENIKVVKKGIIKIKKSKKKYNNNSFKITNFSKKKNSLSVDKTNLMNSIDSYKFSSSKKNKSNYKFDPKYINSLEISSYNMTYNSNSYLQKNKYINKLESIISPKNSLLGEKSTKSLRIDFLSNPYLKEKSKTNKSYKNINSLKHIHLINLKSKNKNYHLNKKNNKSLKEFKDNIISILVYYITLSKKLKKWKESFNFKKTQYFLDKEYLLNQVEKKNIIEEKKCENKIKKYIYVNIHSKINDQIISKFKKVKMKEINIFENIFNIKIDKDDISKQKSNDIMMQEIENNKFNLYLDLMKSVVKYYGNILKIYNDNNSKKIQLLHLLFNNGVEIKTTELLYNDNNSKEIKEYFKEIKEELEEEEESFIDFDKENNVEKNLNISSLSINNNNKMNILDKILISEFPEKYGNITNKTFTKIKNNEYLFNNEFRVLASYNNDKVILKIEDKDDYLNKEYTLDEFISNFSKNEINVNKAFQEIINLKNNKLKMNISRGKYSRNNKIMKETAFKEEVNNKEKKLSSDKSPIKKVIKVNEKKTKIN